PIPMSISVVSMGHSDRDRMDRRNREARQRHRTLLVLIGEVGGVSKMQYLKAIVAATLRSSSAVSSEFLITSPRSTPIEWNDSHVRVVQDEKAQRNPT